MTPEQAGGDEVPVVPDGPPHRWTLLIVLTLVVAAMLVAAFAVTELPQCEDEARFSWAPCLDRGNEPRGQTPAED